MENFSIYFNQFGSLKDSIHDKISENRPLQSGEIRVKMEYVPINPSDLIPVSGAYRARTPLPSLMGYEGVGRVVEVGDKAYDWMIGERVLPLREEGTWQRFVIAKVETAIIVPSGVDDVTAAQSYINPVTAWVLCKKVFHLQSGDTLLINAANSSIGKTFAQLSKIMGFRLIGVIRNEKDRKPLERLEVSVIINSSTQSVQEEVRLLTGGRGVKAAVDSVGSDSGNILARCVMPGGYFRTIGLLSGVQVDWGTLRKELPISTEVFHLRHWIDQSTQEEWQEPFNELFEWMKEGMLLIPKPWKTYLLEHYQDAIQEATSPQKEGKVLFKID